MILCIESNFILELAYLQEEHESCDHLLIMAEEDKIVLAIPSFCVGEPYESWARRRKARQAFSDRFMQELKELSRSRPYSNMRSQSQEITRVLIQSGEEEKRRLDATLIRVAETATIIPLTRETIMAAIRLQGERSLSPQDALVYASVLSHLGGVPDEEKCFLTKNSKDFANPDIDADLRAQNCKLLTSFSNGVAYIRSRLSA